ncbi:MAG: hypothetical protein KGI08_09085, partial [Thaumarchaeota archaeon]|nr:hypothetical protein [Nitrososphaerota archaeon]
IELSESKYPLLKYPGIRKIISSLSGRQRKCMLFMIDPLNMEKWFTLNQLAMNLEYANRESLTKNPVIPVLLSKKYIVKEGDKYRQNFSSMV